MNAFRNNPAIRDSEDGYSAVLVEDLVFTSRIGRGTIRVHVPKGFRTNFASTPWWLWAIFPPRGRWSRAAILHDYIYSQPGECSRFLADALFREAMESSGVPLWRRFLMYYAVRLFGWSAWVRN